MLENLIALEPIQVIRIGHCARIRCLTLDDSQYLHEAVRFIERESTPHHGVDHAEDRRVRTDPERQRQQRDRGKPGTPGNEAQGTSGVLANSFHAFSADDQEGGKPSRPTPPSFRNLKYHMAKAVPPSTGDLSVYCEKSYEKVTCLHAAETDRRWDSLFRKRTPPTVQSVVGWEPTPTPTIRGGLFLLTIAR